MTHLAALLHELGNDAGPAGLVIGANPGARISIEVLVKENEIAPMRIGLEFLEIGEYRSAAFFVPEKGRRQAPRQFPGDIP